MAARIVSIVRSHAGSKPATVRVLDGVRSGSPAGASALPSQQHVWQGASGRLYPHRVYTLIECPPLPPAGYVLVRRDAAGRRTPLRVGIAVSSAPTLNLAEIRQRGAQAGANEVHVNEVHVSVDAAASDAERRLIACDLRAGLLGTLGATPTAEPGPGNPGAD